MLIGAVERIGRAGRAVDGRAIVTLLEVKTDSANPLDLRFLCGRELAEFSSPFNFAYEASAREVDKVVDAFSACIVERRFVVWSIRDPRPPGIVILRILEIGLVWKVEPLRIPVVFKNFALL